MHFSNHPSAAPTSARRLTPVAAFLGALSLTVLATALGAAPAQAVPASRLVGHRCHTYDAAVTNEDTVAALRDVARDAPGAGCEIDTWKISDGTMIVFHDSTWNRVADLSTLPPGVQRNSLVKNATRAQVSQIRTKGGEPIATLEEMIDASAAYHVPLTVEVKNSVTNAPAIVGYARARGAEVSYYRQPGKGCAAAVLDPLRRWGAAIGLKLVSTSDCTLADLQAKGISFVTQHYSAVTAESTGQLRSIGVDVYARNTSRYTSQKTLAAGAAKLTIDSPRAGLSWPGV